jgi:hypothetical protein
MSDWPPTGDDQPRPPAGQGWGMPAPPGRQDDYDRSAAAPRLQPLNVGDVLDGMFRLLVRHWRTYLLALGVVLVPLNLLSSFSNYRLTGGLGLLDTLQDPSANQAMLTTGDITRLLPLFGVTALASLLVTPFLNGVATRIAAEGYLGAKPEPGESLRYTAGRYAALLGATLLLILAAIGMLIPAAVLFFAAATTESGPLAVLAVVAVLFTVLAMISLFALAYPVVIVERAGPFTAVRRSFALGRRRFWGILGIVILASIISGIVGQILSAVFSLPGQLLGDAAGLVLIAVGGVVAGLLTTPLTAAAQTLLYFDGRVRHEGLDLEMAARDLRGDPNVAGGFTG